MTARFPPRRAWWRGRLPLLLIILAAVILGCLAIAGLGDGLVYYRTPTEIATEIADRPAMASHEVRVGGLVVPHSVHKTGGTLSFRLSDGVTGVQVIYTGHLPPVFRAGQSAVAEGVTAPGGVIRADRLMVRHTNEYHAKQPPAQLTGTAARARIQATLPAADRAARAPVRPPASAPHQDAMPVAARVSGVASVRAFVP